MELIGKKAKQLKKIPYSLVSYIIIEGEAVRDANDKMMIVSYAMSKLELIDRYIELIECGSKEYIVPHSKEHLVGVKAQINAAVKTIMNRKINPNRPFIEIKYPENDDK